MKHFTFLAGLCIFMHLSAIAQTEGTVMNKETGEALENAHIYLYHENGISLLEQTASDQDGRFYIHSAVSGGMKLVVTHIGFAISELVLADEPKDLEIIMNQVNVPVGEVSVTALKQDKRLKDVSLPVSIVGSEQITKLSATTPADILMNEPGLNIARDGIWATSINIRGLSQQRIITLVDGNRVETATDLAAGMAMMDVNELERIEVVKGSASSLYGTGATGGVVNFITKDGSYTNQRKFSGGIGYQYHSVNSLNGINAYTQMTGKKFYYRLSGFRRDADNTQTPEGRLENSYFTDNGLSLKMGVKLKENQELKLNGQYFYADNVGIPGGGSLPSAATAYYTEAIRSLLNLSYTVRLKNSYFTEYKVKLFTQNIDRDVMISPNSNISINPRGIHKTLGGQLEGHFLPAKGHSMIAGIDVWNRNLETSRYRSIYSETYDSLGNFVSSTSINRYEIPVPEADFTSAGIFFKDEFKMLDEKLAVDIGGRFDFIRVKNEEAITPVYEYVNDVYNSSPSNQRLTFEADEVYNRSWSANLGLLYSLSDDLKLTASLSRAFRSPSIEERYKYIDLGSMVNIGDPDLKPEKGYFADLGFKVWKEKFQFSLNGFVNRMEDLIVSESGEMVYERLDEPGVYDTIPALINANVDEALLYGYDLSMSYNFYNGFVLFGSSSFVRGINTLTDTDLPLIPPLSGRVGARYLSRKGHGAELTLRMVAEQDKIAEGESTTDGYETVDLRFYTGEMDLKYVGMQISLGVENLLDEAYMNHLSTNRGLVKLEPGRNIYLRIRMNF